MAPVPIYTQSPITAAKPSGVTPQTAAAGEANPASAQQQQQPPPPPTTTADASQGYPAAEPGARPSMPAPTGTVSSQRYAPVQPTPTTKEADSGPPPPQPGAVPVPPGGRTTTTSSSSLPPPPKAGEKYQPPTQQTPGPSMPYYPPQMAVPSPAVPSLHHRGTATATARQHDQQAQAVGWGSGSAGNLDHPPGYHQDVNASEFDSHQRAAHHANVSSERRRGSIPEDGDEDGMWDTAKKLLASAGQKLSEGESAIWRTVNKE